MFLRTDRKLEQDRDACKRNTGRAKFSADTHTELSYIRCTANIRDKRRLKILSPLSLSPTPVPTLFTVIDRTTVATATVLDAIVNVAPLLPSRPLFSFSKEIQ